MKNCLAKSWEDLINHISDKSIIIFGASGAGKMLLEETNHLFKVKYAVDNDPNKWNSKWLNKYEVFSPNKILEEDENSVLVIASQFYDQILMQSEIVGFKGYVYSYLHMRETLSDYSSEEMIHEFATNIDILKNMMADKKSIDIIDEIYKRRIEKSMDYSGICEGGEYFLDGVMAKHDNAVFVDGGAYHAETVEQFIKWNGNQFKRVYSFEMDEKNFDCIAKEKYGEKAKFYNCGLWDNNEEVQFLSSETGSSVATFGKNTATCVKLDDVVSPDDKVTFLKLDIEGAEKRAIIGSTRIIKKDTPQLAICVYHKASDIWEIPFLLHEMVPEYKFYLRHHGNMIYDTVLYATVD